MTKPSPGIMDPLIEGYLSYLDKVGRKTPRTIIDVRCTLRRAIAGLPSDVREHSGEMPQPCARVARVCVAQRSKPA